MKSHQSTLRDLPEALEYIRLWVMLNFEIKIEKITITPDEGTRYLVVFEYIDI